MRSPVKVSGWTRGGATSSWRDGSGLPTTAPRRCSSSLRRDCSAVSASSAVAKRSSASFAQRRSRKAWSCGVTPETNSDSLGSGVRQCCSSTSMVVSPGKGSRPQISSNSEIPSE